MLRLCWLFAVWTRAAGWAPWAGGITLAWWSARWCALRGLAAGRCRARSTFARSCKHLNHQQLDNMNYMAWNTQGQGSSQNYIKLNGLLRKLIATEYPLNPKGNENDVEQDLQITVCAFEKTCRTEYTKDRMESTRIWAQVREACQCPLRTPVCPEWVSMNLLLYGELHRANIIPDEDVVLSFTGSALGGDGSLLVTFSGDGDGEALRPLQMQRAKIRRWPIWQVLTSWPDILKRFEDFQILGHWLLCKLNWAIMGRGRLGQPQSCSCSSQA